MKQGGAGGMIYLPWAVHVWGLNMVIGGQISIFAPNFPCLVFNIPMQKRSVCERLLGGGNVENLKK